MFPLGSRRVCASDSPVSLALSSTSTDAEPHTLTSTTAAASSSSMSASGSTLTDTAVALLRRLTLASSSSSSSLRTGSCQAPSRGGLGGGDAGARAGGRRAGGVACALAGAAELRPAERVRAAALPEHTGEPAAAAHERDAHAVRAAAADSGARGGRRGARRARAATPRAPVRALQAPRAPPPDGPHRALRRHAAPHLPARRLPRVLISSTSCSISSLRWPRSLPVYITYVLDSWLCNYTSKISFSQLMCFCPLALVVNVRPVGSSISIISTHSC